jgi:hypothetical protein
VEYEKTLKAAILGTENYHATMREIMDSCLHLRVHYLPPRMNPDSSLPPVESYYSAPADRLMQNLVRDWFGNEKIYLDWRSPITTVWEIGLKLNRTLATLHSPSDNLFDNCNPRSPYLVLAWLLISSDNKYRICQYSDNIPLLKQVAIMHIRIALGDNPPVSEMTDTLMVAFDRANVPQRNTLTLYWLVWTATVCAAMIATKIHELSHNAVANDARAVAEYAINANASVGLSRVAARIAISTKARQWAHISDEEALQIARQLTFDILSL